MPLPVLIRRPPPEMLPAKLVLLAVPTVSLLPPSTMDVPATPVRSWIVRLPLAPDMSNFAPLAARLTPLDAAMLPFPESARVPALIVVASA
ncbi:unannotated protein [freshwater metagenome]|uniref:Unannotated protein n=1 Tax=freshwater metagenome TaxID=449393 RepID=A0A6J7IM71_9ZZZZ